MPRLPKLNHAFAFARRFWNWFTHPLLWMDAGCYYKQKMVQRAHTLAWRFPDKSRHELLRMARVGAKHESF